MTARAAARGEVTLGEMAFALQAIVLVNGLGGFFWESDWQTEHGLGAYDALERFEALAGAQRGAEAAAEDPDGRPRREIAFEGVRFGYPGADREVLHGLDLNPRGALARDRRPERRRQDDARQAAGHRDGTSCATWTSTCRRGRR